MSEKRVIQCEVYSRVVGYIRPVNQWNPGKQEEFAERAMLTFPDLEYKEEESPVSSGTITPIESNPITTAARELAI
jgi:hypothetical protein